VVYNLINSKRYYKLSTKLLGFLTIAIALIPFTFGSSIVVYERNIDINANVKARNYKMEINANYDPDDIYDNTEWFVATDMGDDAMVYVDFSDIENGFGNSWEFYGKSFSRVYICSNGYAVFNTPTDLYIEPDGDDGPSSFPSSEPNSHYMIAFYFADLDMTYDFWNNFYVGVAYDGSYCVCHFEEIYHFGGTFAGWFHAVLYQDGRIMFGYDFLNPESPYIIGLNCGEDTKLYNEYKPGYGDLDGVSVTFTPRKPLTWLWVILGVVGGIGVIAIIVVFTVIIPKSKAKKRAAGTDSSFSSSQEPSTVYTQQESVASKPAYTEPTPEPTVTPASAPVGSLGDKITSDLQIHIKQLDIGDTVDLADVAKHYNCDSGFVVQLVNNMIDKGIVSGKIDTSTMTFTMGY